MRIFFLNPSSKSLEKQLGLYRFFDSPFSPLWAGYLSSISLDFTDEIYVVDNYVERLDVRSVVQTIKQTKPDILCISVITQTANFSYNVAKAVRSILPKTKIIMGHTHASYFADEIVSKNLADIVVIGEGEETFRDILRLFQRYADLYPEDLKNVKGIVFRQDGIIFKTPERERIKNIDSLPFPAWHLFRKYFKHYTLYPFMPARRNSDLTLTFLASRGCPFSCNFCTVLMGNRYIIRSPQNICDEIEFFNQEFGCKNFFFVDPLFPPSKSLGLKILEYMAKRKIGNIASWECETRVDIIDDELSEALREAGCEMVSIGIETADDSLLENLNKKQKVERVKKAVGSLKKFGIKVMGLYMLGVPGETKESAKKTISFAKSLDTDITRLSILVPYPGSDLYEKYLNGKYNFSDQDWEYFSTYPQLPYYHYKIDWTELRPSDLFYLQLKANIYTNFSLKKILRVLSISRSKIIVSCVKFLFNLVAFLTKSVFSQINQNFQPKIKYFLINFQRFRN
ncbi:MAG: B12-binding domain-containing radical SAM protein [Candidatus Calescibacterium sp.]|nr:B12-binding domain-containing radical SAM protein [Candidatus Calescibacterium sp.]